MSRRLRRIWFRRPRWPWWVDGTWRGVFPWRGLTAADHVERGWNWWCHCGARGYGLARKRDAMEAYELHACAAWEGDE